MNYGEFFKSRRLALDMTQEQVAEIVGVHATTISDYERNIYFPEENNLKKLSVALGFEKLITK